MENNELDLLCDQIINKEIKPLKLNDRHKIERYLDGYSLENSNLKSPGFSQEVKKMILKKLDIKKENISYNYKKKILSEEEKKILQKKIYEIRKFEKLSAKNDFLTKQEHFKKFISDPNLFLSMTFKQFCKKINNENL